MFQNFLYSYMHQFSDEGFPGLNPGKQTDALGKQL